MDEVNGWILLGHSVEDQIIIEPSEVGSVLDRVVVFQLWVCLVLRVGPMYTSGEHRKHHRSTAHALRLTKGWKEAVCHRDPGPKMECQLRGQTLVCMKGQSKIHQDERTFSSFPSAVGVKPWIVAMPCVKTSASMPSVA